MLFNSYEYIFLLLPIALIGSKLLGGRYDARVAWLLACSLFFYAWWNPLYLPLLLATILGNFYLGDALRSRPTKPLLALGVAANLCLLGYYKYAGFFLESLGALTSVESSFHAIALPLGISFFTFQQIAYLSDCYQGLAQPYRFTEYGLFVSFFPQLIAGPIVHHAEMMPQIRSPFRAGPRDISVGSTIFFLGLFKKTVLADGIAPYANALFNDPNAWQSVTFFHAWIGVLAYGLQIYFDFSGYSDMAIGSARMLGIKLPLNFFAPYRSETISDFWHRWHMTLSRFLRDYLYIPLGGNRDGTAKRYRNLMITMFLGGLWHGAGWTFILWGLLHGGYLVVQQIWSRSTDSLNLWKSRLPYRLAALLITFLAVQFAWVYFRALSIESANRIAMGMFGFHGFSLPQAILLRMGGTANWFSSLGINADPMGGSAFVLAITWILCLTVIAWLFPTTQEFMRNYEPAWEYANEAYRRRIPQGDRGFTLPLVWRPSVLWSIVMSLVTAAGLLSLTQLSEFLYFQF